MQRDITSSTLPSRLAQSIRIAGMEKKCFVQEEIDALKAVIDEKKKFILTLMADKAVDGERVEQDAVGVGDYVSAWCVPNFAAWKEEIDLTTASQIHIRMILNKACAISQTNRLPPVPTHT